MINRYMKIGLAIFVALFCLFYATQNVVNLDAAYYVVNYVLSMEGHEYYPEHFGPPLGGVLVWAALWVIILLEYAAGVLAGKGAWDLWSARNSPAAEFNACKKWIMAAAGMALVVWFGLFTAIGGAYFQMWQTQTGAQSLAGAFQFVGSIALVALYINIRDA